MSINAISRANPMPRFNFLRNTKKDQKGSPAEEKDIVHGMTLAAGLGTGAVCAIKGKSAAETVRKTGVTLAAELAKGATKLWSFVSKKFDAGKAGEAIESAANKLRQSTDAVDPKFQEGVSKLLGKCTGNEQAQTIETALKTFHVGNPCAAADVVAAAAVGALIADDTADMVEIGLDKLDEQFQEMPDWDC